MISNSNKNRTRIRAAACSTLNKAGTKVTNQRAVILEIIQQGRGHLDADEIYRQARLKQPRLSLSTVYRTLKTLKKLELVNEVHIDETHHHYESKQAKEHYHLVCLDCGRIIEINYPLIRQIRETVPDARDFEFNDMEFRATGYCSACRLKRQYQPGKNREGNSGNDWEKSDNA